MTDSRARASAIRSLDRTALKVREADALAALARSNLHDAIHAASRDGLTVREIAEHVGLTYGRVAQILRADG